MTFEELAFLHGNSGFLHGNAWWGDKPWYATGEYIRHGTKYRHQLKKHIYNKRQIDLSSLQYH
ncbi:hypothetical protein [Nostoc linckia]|uniref:hypothetical protein n=1 Tax=Nostoc linckia TaxID=92942 RepID=UPI00117FBA10|nr:hypothetical protein [Nostoc linckia]